MAHIEKYQASALGNMLGHYERRAEIERANGWDLELNIQGLACWYAHGRGK